MRKPAPGCVCKLYVSLAHTSAPPVPLAAHSLVVVVCEPASRMLRGACRPASCRVRREPWCGAPSSALGAGSVRAFTPPPPTPPSPHHARASLRTALCRRRPTERWLRAIRWGEADAGRSVGLRLPDGMAHQRARQAAAARSCVRRAAWLRHGSGRVGNHPACSMRRGWLQTCSVRHGWLHPCRRRTARSSTSARSSSGCTRSATWRFCAAGG